MGKYLVYILFFLFIGIYSNAQDRKTLPQKGENKDRLSRFIDRKLSENLPKHENQKYIIFDGTKSDFIWAEQLQDNTLSVKYSANDQYTYEIVGSDIVMVNLTDGISGTIAQIKEEQNNITTFYLLNETDLNSIGTYNAETQQIFNQNYDEVGRITNTNDNYQIVDKNNKLVLSIGDVDLTLAIFFFLNDYLPLKNLLSQ